MEFIEKFFHTRYIYSGPKYTQDSLEQQYAQILEEYVDPACILTIASGIAVNRDTWLKRRIYQDQLLCISFNFESIRCYVNDDNSVDIYAYGTANLLYYQTKETKEVYTASAREMLILTMKDGKVLECTEMACWINEQENT